MSGELTSIGDLLPVLASEARRRRLAIGLVVAAIALGALVLGLAWPKKYQASTTILAQTSSIITPLMEGAASTTGISNRAGIAKDVIFSRSVMTQILAAGSWMDVHPSPVEQDRLIEDIKSRTRVQISRDNLITITYHDSDAERAFRVVRRFGQLFISESLASKQRESRDAFQFINSQVEAYRSKLTDAEDKLEAYRDKNPDARSGSEADTNSSISQLRAQIESTRMTLMEKRSQEASIRAQLGGESEVNAVQTRQGIYQTQLAQLQSQLETLLLTYTDDYPDVVRVRHQIQDLKQQISQGQQRNANAHLASGGGAELENNVQFNPLYQQLKGNLAATRSESAATAARLQASESMLASAMERSQRIASSSNVISELTRDYNVNRDVYQDLLKRRENARVSMNLDATQRGLTFIVQNPATLPLVPTGPRFVHFAMGGLLLSVIIPLGLLFGIARFDPRVRSVAQIEHLTGLHVLASVPFYPTPLDRRRDRLQNSMLVLMAAAVVAAYLIFSWLKLKGYS